jgi:hypothetical protein
MLKKRLLSEARESMTLPDERYRAIKIAEQLLRDLCDPAMTPRVPQVIRIRAASALRHYPGSYDLKQLEAAAPHVVQERMEPLYKMLKQHEMADSVTEDYRAEGMIAAQDDHEGSTPD